MILTIIKILLISIKSNIQHIKSLNIKEGSVVAIVGDFSPNSISLLFSLIKLNCIIVPFNRKNKLKILNCIK